MRESTEKELTDEPFRLRERDLLALAQEDARAARWSGEVDALIPALEDAFGGERDQMEVLRICCVGCGAGAVPLAVANWARGAGISAFVTGVEIHPAVAGLARRNCRRALGAAEGVVQIVEADARLILSATTRRVEPETDSAEMPTKAEPFDVVVASQFLHHYDPVEAAAWLKLFESASSRGWIAVDFVRETKSRLAMQAASRLARASDRLRNELSLSVRRSWSPEEWRDLVRRRAGLRNVHLRRSGMARIVVTSFR